MNTRKIQRQIKPKIDPSEIRICTLSEECDVNAFSCGYTKIDGYFHNHSKIDHSNYETRSAVAFRQGILHPIGFYTLCLKEDSSLLFVNHKSFVVRYFKEERIITAHLKWFGIDIKHQRQGIGSLMLGKILDDFYEVAIRTGIFVLTVDAISEEAVLFYKSLGFQNAEGHDRKLNLPIEDVIAARTKFLLS